MRIEHMVKSLPDQRNWRITAAAVERMLQSDQPDFARESRLLDSKSRAAGTRAAGSTEKSRAHDTATSRKPSSFAATNHLPRSPRASISSTSKGHAEDVVAIGKVTKEIY